MDENVEAQKVEWWQKIESSQMIANLSRKVPDVVNGLATVDLIYDWSFGDRNVNLMKCHPS